ncbi:twin-arginine translocase subunit TatB [Aquibium carbonis]|uniref:Sec-independent protein translocase protein TatB n=1 Tax=Aquibium carbonis TaxID=2495581 RepID=A0A429YYF9_9HYPH|nr:Sec-independent protein translocase protein TatB [Aquibium carbonis]RST86497.1 twin-arginine translocase subunit TatB [Aquibium carbonis]
MFDIGWPEMMVIAVVLIVVVGPKDLPRMLRTFGKTTSSLRRMAGDFRKQFDDALKEAELDDVKSTIDAARKLNPAADIRKALNPMEKAASDVRAGLDGLMKPQPNRVPSADAPATPAEPAKAGPTAMPGEPAVAAASSPQTAKPEAPSAPAVTAPAIVSEPVAAAPKPTTARASPVKRSPAKTTGADKPASSGAAKPAPRKAPAAKKSTGAAS